MQDGELKIGMFWSPTKQICNCTGTWLCEQSSHVYRGPLRSRLPRQYIV